MPVSEHRMRTTDRWYYLDRVMEQYGPFDGHKMRFWVQNGGFGGSGAAKLLIRLEDWNNHYPADLVFYPSVQQRP